MAFRLKFCFQLRPARPVDEAAASSGEGRCFWKRLVVLETARRNLI